MKIKKLNEDVQHCWFGYYIDKDGNQKYFYMTKDSTSKDPDEASDIMEDSIPEPFTKFVFQGSVANTQAEKQGWKLVECKSIKESIDTNNIQAVANANDSKVIYYNTWNELLKERDALCKSHIRMLKGGSFVSVIYRQMSADICWPFDERTAASLEKLFERYPRYKGLDVCVAKELLDTDTKPNESLSEGIEIETIADYITDHYKFETIDDKYSCIDSIRNSFKDEKNISKEELEQFIGAHNGEDKVNESKSISEGRMIDRYKEQVKKNFEAEIDNTDISHEIAEDGLSFTIVRADGTKLEYNAAEGFTTTEPTNGPINESKATHCVYFTQDGRDQIEFEGTEDACYDYIASIESEQDDEFGDEAPERFIKRLNESMKDYRFEVSCNDGPTKVVKLIWDENDVEGAKEVAKEYYAQEHTTYADDRHNKWVIEESLNEALSPKEGDRVQMDFYAKDNNGATGTCTGRIGELCFIEWDDGTKSKEIKGYLKVIERPNMNEASYGGAFDIADDQIFTREDIDNLAEEVLNHINETYEYKFDISAAYIDGNELEVGVENDELGEYMTTLKIDMGKVKEPWHLKRVYAFEVASDLINQISRSLNDLGESLTESATEDAKPIETGAAVGMATILSDLIKDEYEAIDGYNAAIATAEAEGFGDMVKVLTDIQAEENIHIGQLQELMKMVDPNASKIEDGTVEAEELLSNPSVNDDDDFDFEGIDESFDVSEDDIADEDVDAAIKAVEEAMKEPNKEEIDLTSANFDLEDDDEVIIESTEPWEDIYNSFKDIEVQLNGDGEAITATIDRIYNDNKGNPDFEKAYKKWAANE